MHTISEKKLIMLKPEEIKKSVFLPRKSFDKYEMKKLSESIASSGVIQPLVIRKNEEGEYELISGQRRLKAAIEAGLRRVPCVVHKVDEAYSAAYSIIENTQRISLNPFEEARALQNLIIDYGFSISEISAKLGIEEFEVSQKMRLLRIGEEIENKIISASLSQEYAFLLLTLPSYKRLQALDYIIAESLTIKQTEDYIKAIINPRVDENLYSEEKPVRRAVIGDMRLFSNSLAKLVDTLESAGLTVSSRRSETERYIEYKVRIKKEPAVSATQLKIC